MTTGGSRLIIEARGKNSLRLPIYYPGVSLAGVVASFQIRHSVDGLPGSKVLEKTSGTDAELTISHTSSALTIGGRSVPAGSGVVTLDLYPDTIQAIPAGEYYHELKLIWPSVSGAPSYKEPLYWGPFVRQVTINDA